MHLRSTIHVVAWVALGALLMLGLLGIASIGLFVLAPTTVAFVLLARRSDPDVAALAIGAGIVLLTLGLGEQLDGTPTCTDAGVSDPPTEDSPSQCEEGGIPAAAFWGPGLAAVLAGASTLSRRGRS